MVKSVRQKGGTEGLWFYFTALQLCVQGEGTEQRQKHKRQPTSFQFPLEKKQLSSNMSNMTYEFDVMWSVVSSLLLGVHMWALEERLYCYYVFLKHFLNMQHTENTVGQKAMFTRKITGLSWW